MCILSFEIWSVKMRLAGFHWPTKLWTVLKYQCKILQVSARSWTLDMLFFSVTVCPNTIKRITWWEKNSVTSLNPGQNLKKSLPFPENAVYNRSSYNLIDFEKVCKSLRKILNNFHYGKRRLNFEIKSNGDPTK